MKVNTTYGELNTRLNEITMFENQYPTIARFLRQDIEKFNKDNALFIGFLKEKIQKLYDKHLNKKANGDYATYEKITEHGPVYLPEYKSDEDEKQYEESFATLMQQPCTIIL